MSKQVIITGRTVEEAMEQAKKEYGGSEWELSYEILEMPKRGFFGIGAAPAKLRVTISRALEEVNLSDLVSEIRNMKITTDPDGAVEERPNRNSRYDNRDNRDNRSDNRDNRSDNRTNRYENGGSRPNANSRNNNRYNNAENRTDSRNAQTAPAAKPEMKPAAPVTQSEKIEQQVKPQTQSTAKPVAQPVVAPVAQPAPVKPEAKPVEQGNALPSNELPGNEQLPGNELPAALRPPKSRPQQNKTNRKPKNAPNSNPKTVENRPQEEKKKDLMAAILGIGAAAQPQTQTQAQHEQVAPAAQTQAQPAPVEKISVNVSVDVSVDGSAIGSNTDARSADGHLGFVPQREMEYALSFLRTLLADLDMTAQANAADAPEGVEVPDGFAYAKIDITGRDTAILIGHHGDTMDSLQYLLNLSALRHSTADKKDYVKIVLDVEGYRVKREETLRALARRMAAKAVRYKRNMVLDPMNPYERRIIHSELQGVENISTHSVGSDENRKIVIFYEGADRVRDNRRRNDRPQRRPQQQTKSDAQSDAAEAKTTTTTYHHPERRREKPVRAKSIDEIKIDLSEASSATFGSLNTEISADEGYEKDPDPIETMETNSDEENLREY